MLLSLIAAAALAAGAATPPATAAETCAILAAVGRSQHQLDRRIGPPLRASGDFLPDCDWTAYGLRGFADPVDWPKGRFFFGRPEVRGDRASVRTGVVLGPRSGDGRLCELRRRRGRWQVERCSRTWVM